MYDCVLLVDDDGINNFINRKILSELNIASRIEVVNDGKSALKFILSYSEENNNRCPGLILLDINMPRMDGFTFMDHFEMLDFDNKSSVKIIILSSSEDVKDLSKAKQFQLDGYIVKPLTDKKLKMLEVI